MAAGRSEVDDKDIKLIEKCPVDVVPKVSQLYKNADNPLNFSLN